MTLETYSRYCFRFYFIILINCLLSISKVTREFHTLINSEDLVAASRRAEKLVLLDCRTVLGAPDAGPAAWAAGHIAGAVHANLETQLAAPAHSKPGNLGGRHPLPEREKFSRQCGAWGIDATTQVVAYDDAGGAYAARAWWLLRWLGHSLVAVLDGGLDSWTRLATGTLVSSEADTAERPTPVRFVAREPLTRIAELAEIQALAANPDGQPTTHLIDARAQERFTGQVEPIDPVAGHIPSALCMPLTGNLDNTGHFLGPAQLASRFNSNNSLDSSNGENLICYCGSGVTAAHNILAICHAGLPEPALYVGSWSEWCADSTRPIEVGESA